MFLSLFLLSIFTAEVFGGSICPPRENIYPCSCTNVPMNKNLFMTSVYCHHVHSTDSLTAIFPSLRTMQIDVLHLYDSFWEAHKLEKNGEDKKVLPVNWLSQLKVKEFDIVDTTLSQCFACQSNTPCKNTVTQKFSVTNSSSHETICTLCNTGKSPYSWINCMSRLKHFHFSHGKLSNISKILFVSEMKDLTLLNLTHNEISYVDANVMKNFPRLKALDLSHNNIRSLGNIFNVAMKNLEYLDVSWNDIQVLGNSFFKNLPFLKTFNVAYNSLTELKEIEWGGVTDKLKNIDLTDNQIHCDCNIRWLNSTFHVSAVLSGRCYTPEEYENSLLRKASRMLNERCDGNSIGTRNNKKPTKAMQILRLRRN